MSEQVLVQHVFAAVEARFTGVTADGTPVVVLGIVVGGPDPVNVGGVPMLAVLVRDYQGSPDLLVYVAEDATAEMVEDTDEDNIWGEYAIDPVYPAGAARVWLDRRVPAPKPRKGSKPQQDDWSEEIHVNVSPEQLAEWETGCGNTVRLRSVDLGHLPIPTELLPIAFPEFPYPTTVDEVAE